MNKQPTKGPFQSCITFQINSSYLSWLAGTHRAYGMYCALQEDTVIIITITLLLFGHKDMHINEQGDYWKMHTALAQVYRCIIHVDVLYIRISFYNNKSSIYQNNKTLSLYYAFCWLSHKVVILQKYKECNSNPTSQLHLQSIILR